jgi:hypothetical protein
MPLKPPEGNWSDYDVDDTALKVWIPESLDICLQELAVRFEQTKSDLARNALMIHTHGRYVFERLVENKLWRLRRRQQKEDTEGRIVKFNLQGSAVGPKESPRTKFISAFGKNTEDLKIWMPKKLESLINRLASEAGLTASEYARRALTAYYLGRTIIDPIAPPDATDK